MSGNFQNKAVTVFIETYGCQMNKYDSEIAAGMLDRNGFSITDDIDEADAVIINACSIREHAEQKIMGRLGVLSQWKKMHSRRKLGLIGCMAQRMKQELLTEKSGLDFIVGPDQYRELPDILTKTTSERFNRTSFCETENYDDIQPLRDLKISGWVAIMRGCNNFCSYCIVPYTRGRERSRSLESILKEIHQMIQNGCREVTLLGQNVNSYHDGENNFPDLLKKISQIDGLYRIRFMTSHPKDLSENLLETIASEKRICKHIHLPVQSGSNRILSMMNRKYTRENYLALVKKARSLISDVSITSDIMVGFPGETDQDFEDTIHLMTQVKFDEAYTYHYSRREGTRAAEMEENLSKEEKLIRLNRIIQLQQTISLEKKQLLIGNVFEVLPEKESRRSSNEWMGKTDTNHTVVFPKEDSSLGCPVDVQIQECKGTTLKGRIAGNHASLFNWKSGREICGL
jgi:tRNA-2-methylthio-N6-dimethylallyladenosine synthase